MPNQTGPKTPEGKAKSSQNATKHGLTSNRMYVLGNENDETWERVHQLWTDKLQPRDDAEAMIVDDIAHAQWRLRRAFTIETGMIDLQMDLQADYMTKTFDAFDEATRITCAFKALGDESRGLDHIHRYETRARRAFQAGISALDKLRRLTAEPAVLPEPKPVPAPEPPKPELVPERPKPVPGMPAYLHIEWERLTRDIACFDPSKHSRYMSPELRNWAQQHVA
jgi:hypothetical protein